MFLFICLNANVTDKTIWNIFASDFNEEYTFILSVPVVIFYLFQHKSNLITQPICYLFKLIVTVIISNCTFFLARWLARKCLIWQRCPQSLQIYKESKSHSRGTHGRPVHIIATDFLFFKLTPFKVFAINLAKSIIYFHTMSIALKIMHPILLCWHTTPEVDVGSMAVWTFPSIFHYILLLCVWWQQRTVWQNGIWRESAYEVKVCNWIPQWGRNDTHWHSFMLAECLWRLNVEREHSEEVGGVYQQ